MAVVRPPHSGSVARRRRYPSRRGAPAAWEDQGVDPLDDYRRKRNPGRTPEPMPAATAERAAGGPGADGSAGRGEPPAAGVFVVQEHHARRLHWDFRLERDGVLVSWALPKGMPDDPAANHLAVPTEDHPMEYASFSGEIPRGEYGEIGRAHV